MAKARFLTKKLFQKLRSRLVVQTLLAVNAASFFGTNVKNVFGKYALVKSPNT